MQNLKNDSTELDAQLILAHVLGHPRTWLLAHLDAHLTPPQIESTTQTFDEYQAGTPLPYILGHWDFFGLEFDITKDVLIPRPETEMLVENAIDWLRTHPEKRTIADIGTGSGAIAITLALQIPDAHILATDISPAALQVAKHNAEKFNVQDKIEFMECDLLPPSSFIIPHSSFDLICSNPPYIPTGTLHQLPIFGREPTLALDGGTDGLNAYRRLFKLAPDWLAPHGMILLETEATIGVHVLSLAYDSFSNVAIHLHQDLAGHDRLVQIQFHS
ncbi:MAG: peptide chain release factor N(5)-glutamine methyltransferase [Anaerolineales bacterium]|uniref:peptide chain release factor N(5)-glutamine methyltransferase n=1 Tax=Candidatus Villigracilis proximus TaxID=3140683 RepID=UPI0031367C98|nr:peptide chain release factor N(5)-glutamine methyltransferase [Anaerolineales bacterium]